jgi:hypothetical protein
MAKYISDFLRVGFFLGFANICRMGLGLFKICIDLKNHLSYTVFMKAFWSGIFLHPISAQSWGPVVPVTSTTTTTTRKG